jgi:hypothetical protein
MLNVAVICVALTTVTLLKLRDGLELDSIAPAIKFAPVSVTGTLLPAPPLFGLIEVRTGAGAVDVTVNATPLLVPPVEVTVTLSDPSVAFDAIPNVAVI